jgi:hypothetical protein
MALFGVLALFVAFAATSASAALPDVHVVEGGKYPVTGEGSVGNGTAIVGTLLTAIGEKLTTTKVTAIAKLEELSALGPGELIFTGVKEKAGFECHTATFPEGEVKFSGEYHVVYTGLTTLTAGVLILFAEQTVVCNKEKLKIKVKAPALIKLNVVPGTSVASYKLESACTKGKQEPNEYYNEEGALTVANLLANFGLGFEKSCYFGEPLTVKSSQNIDFLF